MLQEGGYFNMNFKWTRDNDFAVTVIRNIFNFGFKKLVKDFTAVVEGPNNITHIYVDWHEEDSKTTDIYLGPFETPEEGMIKAHGILERMIREDQRTVAKFSRFPSESEELYHDQY